MELRSHPLMGYRGLNNWPPIWTWRGVGEDARPRGEVGILRDVFLSKVDPRARIYLIMEYEAAEYMGCLLFEESGFCKQMCELLNSHRGASIVEIGSLNVSHLL